MPIIRVNPILPPSPKMAVQVKPQHVHWQVGKYRDTFSIGPGGVGRKQIWTPQQENEQHNLLLDHLFTSLVLGSNGGFLNQSIRAHVGTGSTAPLATQTGLQTPLVSTEFIPSGENDAYIYISPGIHDIRRVKEFTEAEVGNQNLTEWGFGRSTANSLMCRELFRDGSGNPITLTPASDQRLRLIYTYRVQYSPATAQAVTVNIAGLGNRTGQFVLTRARDRYQFNSYSSNYAGLGFWNSYTGGIVADGGDLLLMETIIRGVGIDFAEVSSFAGTNALAVNNYSDTGGADADTIFPPSYITLKTNVGRSRKFDIVYGSNQFNINIRSLGLAVKATTTNTSFSVLTARLVFDAGQTINKTNLYKLVMNDWEVTW